MATPSGWSCEDVNVTLSCEDVIAVVAAAIAFEKALACLLLCFVFNLHARHPVVLHPLRLLALGGAKGLAGCSCEPCSSILCFMLFLSFLCSLLFGRLGAVLVFVLLLASLCSHNPKAINVRQSTCSGHDGMDGMDDVHSIAAALLLGLINACKGAMLPGASFMNEHENSLIYN
jgi:hypothetical protein